MVFGKFAEFFVNTLSYDLLNACSTIVVDLEGIRMNKTVLISTMIMTIMFLMVFITPVSVFGARQIVKFVGKGTLTEIDTNTEYQIRLYFFLDTSEFDSPVIGGNGWARLTTTSGGVDGLRVRLEVPIWRFNRDSKMLEITATFRGEEVMSIVGKAIKDTQTGKLQVDWEGPLEMGVISRRVEIKILTCEGE